MVISRKLCAYMGRRDLTAAFGTVIKAKRQKAGISQEALGYAAGLHRTYVGMVERGEKKPTLDAANRLALALGTQLSALVRAAERRLERMR